MKNKSSRPSELRLERHLLGELSAREETSLRIVLESDESAHARLREIEASTSDIISSYPPERMARLILERMEKEDPAKGGAGNPDPARPAPKIFPRYLPRALGVAAALLVAFLGVAGLTGILPGSKASLSEDTRVKGGLPQLMLYRKAGTGAERLSDGALARKNDVLQIGYEIGSRGFGAIFSIDGRGLVTFHLPSAYQGGRVEAPRLEDKGPNLLQSAYELDDAPAFERFFLVYSKHPFDLDPVAIAAKGLASDPEKADQARLELSAAYSWTSLRLEKKR